MHSRIFVICPDNAAPSGGVRKIYRHVDILNRHGYDATIIHTEVGFRCNWFSHQTPVDYLPNITPLTSDVLLVPEVCGPLTITYAPGVAKIIFNQNCYTTFQSYRLDQLGELPYLHPDIIATLTVSEDSAVYLRHAFPSADVFRIHYGVDTQLFAETEVKQSMIGLMPRKNQTDVVQVLAMLTTRQALSGFQVVLIHDLSEAEVAHQLQKCNIFLSFGYPEGFGLPPAEAMACGCAVIGFHGNGGREFFRPEFSWPVEVGDILGYVKTVEAVLDELRNNPESMRRKARAGAQFICDNYSLEQEEADIVGFWKGIFQNPRFLQRF